MNTRIKSLLTKMQELSIDAMLIGSRSNRLYISGFSGSNAMLYISPKKRILITDFRYLEQAKGQCPDFEIIDQGSIGLIQSLLKIGEEDGARYIGFESDHTNYTTYLELKKHLACELVPTTKLVESLRQIKDEEELCRLRQAEHIGDIAFTHIVSFITQQYKAGLTEKDVALELERVMRVNGASGTSFNAIVAAGAKSALPHAEPGDETFKTGDFIVLDFGCIYKGYCSDMTRTLIIGEPTPTHQKIYDTVLRAQLAALESIRPGMLGKEVDQIAREMITEAGYGAYFGHGLGHGTGLDIHESPRFSPSDDTVIQKGMIMSVEPGIYIPGFGGVRIEDLVVITNEGVENLTSSSKELIIIK